MYTIEPRLRASPRHGGPGIFYFWLLIRRGGVPSGAAVSIIKEKYRWYSFIMPEFFDFHGKSCSFRKLKEGNRYRIAMGPRALTASSGFAP